MKKNIYKYNKFDPKKNRSLYQYSSFHGKKFFNYYYFSREKIIKNLPKIELSKNYKILSKKKILNLCREFEVKKRIYFDKSKKKEFSLSAYVIFSKQISIQLKKKMDFSIFSTYLKINDYISFCYKKKNIKTNKDIYKIFQDEINLTKKIIYEKIR